MIQTHNSLHHLIRGRCLRAAPGVPTLGVWGRTRKLTECLSDCLRGSYATVLCKRIYEDINCAGLLNRPPPPLKPLVREHILGVEELRMEDDDLAVARAHTEHISEEGVVVHGRRDRLARPPARGTRRGRCAGPGRPRSWRPCRWRACARGGRGRRDRRAHSLGQVT